MFKQEAHMIDMEEFSKALETQAAERGGDAVHALVEALLLDSYFDPAGKFSHAHDLGLDAIQLQNNRSGILVEQEKTSHAKLLSISWRFSSVKEIQRLSRPCNHATSIGSRCIRGPGSDEPYAV
jgi:hypothetical protein